MQRRPAGTPFCFWFGSSDPHRPYEAGTGVTSSDAAGKIQLPEFLPDTPEVRSDLLDYYYEVERFDRDLGLILAALERAGELDNTIVIVTSDNGLPFPRAKATVYDGGVRVPLAIRWPGVARPGTTVDALVSLTDIAPTLLEGAGVAAVSTMTGRTLAPLLRGEAQAGRDQVFLERERHANVRRGDLSYPVRAVRTNDYLYVRNFRPRPLAGRRSGAVFCGWAVRRHRRRPDEVADPGAPLRSIDREIFRARHGQAVDGRALRPATRSAPVDQHRRSSGAPRCGGTSAHRAGSLDA